ncbi:hypothetical protein FJZ53_05435, partial [Candidatus Woesearchaeota archaeon]|nr:hypothetical protein [Candidatus Woesearchaeota archaeon]
MAQDFSLRYPLVNGQGNFGCFTIDTKIALTDGRNLSFKELIEEHKNGKKNYTYTINDRGSIEIAEIINPRLTKKNQKIIKVILDNGEDIKCTLNHRFMLRDGQYKEAQYLKPEDSLMPLYLRLSTEKDSVKPSSRGYQMIYQPNTDNWVPSHNLADDWNLRNKVYDRTAGRIRHHFLSRYDAVTPEVYEAERHNNCIPKVENAVKYFGSFSEIIEHAKKYNHKIVGIEFLEEESDVYDLTIEGTHNFSLASGIFVHNSIDGDAASAMRYTESKMTKIAEEIILDIDKETVDFIPNYDGSESEPTVLPSK